MSMAFAGQKTKAWLVVQLGVECAKHEVWVRSLAPGRRKEERGRRKRKRRGWVRKARKKRKRGKARNVSF